MPARPSGSGSERPRCVPQSVRRRPIHTTPITIRLVMPIRLRAITPQRPIIPRGAAGTPITGATTPAKSRRPLDRAPLATAGLFLIAVLGPEADAVHQHRQPELAAAEPDQPAKAADRHAPAERAAEIGATYRTNHGAPLPSPLARFFVDYIARQSVVLPGHVEQPGPSLFVGFGLSPFP